MKAIMYEHYGPPEVLQLREIDKPVPKENEVLIKVQAATVTKYDCWQRNCTAPPGFGLASRLASGFSRPKRQILGTDLSGEIEATGTNVTRFTKGDQVIAFTGMRLGAYAEYVCLPEEGGITRKPASMTFDEAAGFTQGALTALYFLRKGNIGKGQKLLVFGASGGIGLYAVQLAKFFGAEVTGVCSTGKTDLVRSLGADEVIDYTKEDFTENGETYDTIFDTVGKTSVLRAKRSLKGKGHYVLATFGLPMLIQSVWLSISSSRKVVSGLVQENSEELGFLTDLIKTGDLKSVVDRCFPFEQVVEAHRYVESGLKKGSVVITT